MAGNRFFEISPERLELLRAKRRREGLEAAEAIPRRPPGEAPPPSFGQERLWFLDRLTGGRARLVIPAALRLRGPLDPERLGAALGAVVARHEPLRSRFPERDGRPTVEIVPPAPVPLPRVDLSALPPQRRRPEAERLAGAFGAFPFDLARGPLLVALLADLGRGAAEESRSGVREHALLLAVHHAVADGWSMGVLFRELMAAYGALESRGDRAPPSPGRMDEPPVRYGDWAAWLRRRLSGEALEEEVGWWRRRLEGAPPVLDLPADRPRAPVESFRGGSVRHLLPADRADRLRALGRGLEDGEATPFMVLLAVLGVLLSRWTGEDDLVVGTPVAGRTRREVEGLVGLFLNHLALRLDLAGDPTFRQLLRRVRDGALGAFAHQELPFERLLEELAVPRDLATTPLFQVYLNLMSFPPPPRDPGGGLEIAPLAPARPPARFDLTLYADDRGPGEGLALDLVYDARRFTRHRMELALEQLVALLEGVAAEPDRPVGDLSLLTAAARRALPDPSRPLDASWPGPVDAAVARRAAVEPDRPAVWRADGAAVSYGRLATAVADLASRLPAGRGDVVAVLARREPALVAAVLAIQRAGAAFLLLDPAHPPLRNAACLEAAAPRVLLVPEAGGPLPEPVRSAAERRGCALLPLPPLLPESRVAVDGATVDPVPSVPPAPGRPFPSPDLSPDLSPDDLAYVAFTSGSTGEPKGVMGLHRSLTHFLPWQAETFSLGPDDRFALLSGLAHDPLHRDLFTPLWVGGSVAVPDPERSSDAGWLVEWLAAARVTVVHGTPSLLRLLAEEAGGRRLPDLRWVFLVGEALHDADVERAAVLAPRALVINLYGSTETQRAVAWCRPRRRTAEGEGGVVPLGRGMPDVQLLVLDRRGRQAGVGELGEIHVRSPHLAGGYLGRPAETAAAFLPDGFAAAEESADPPADPPVRLYRTGDLGRYRPDGQVEPKGRRDRQLKVLGVRMEPGEVEAALASHPAVAEAVVDRVGEGAAARLAAWWVAVGGTGDAGSSLPASELRAHLARRLPAAMVPSLLVELPSLPRNPNGKVDRRRLPPPDTGAPAASTAPATPTEERLAAIWREVLEVERVGRDDDFFSRGGHSLALVRVLARVRETFAVELPVRTAFEAPTLAAQAAAVDRVAGGRAGDGRGPRGADPGLPTGSPAGATLAAGSGGTPAATVAATAMPAGPPLRPGLAAEDGQPVSYGQRRLWFLDRMNPGSTAYTLSGAVELAGALDVGALRAALVLSVRRQDALRTALPAPDGVPVQRVAPPAAPGRPPSSDPSFLPRVDLGSLPADRRGGEADRLADAAARHRFDLARGPLLVCRLLRLDGQRHRLLLSVHHAVADGWSLALLAEELGEGYSAAVEGRPSRLPRLEVRYADWAAWQRRRLDAPVAGRFVGGDRTGPRDEDGLGGAVGPVAAGPAVDDSTGSEPTVARDRPVRSTSALLAPEVPAARGTAAEEAAAEGSAAGLAWWRRRLAGLPPSLELPTDRPRGPREDFRGAHAEGPLPPSLAAALDRRAGSAGTTRFVLLLTALGVVLSRWSGQHDLVVGSPEAGRERREVEPLVGLFLNLLVLRLDLSGDPTLGQLLERVRAAVVETFAHREVPFERLLEEVAPPRDAARPPLVEVLLNVFQPPLRPRGFAGLEARLVPPAEREARFPLTLYAAATGDGPLRAVYRRSLFDAARVEELLDQVVAVLEALAEDPERPLAAVSLLTARAKAVLADPAVPLPAPEVLPVPDRFAAVAALHRQRPAVEQGDRIWTYGRLADEVDRLAARLADGAGEGLGVRGRVVAVEGRPGFALVAAALAVLRAGGVLLFLDPDLPVERRRRMAGLAAVHHRLEVEGDEVRGPSTPGSATDAAVGAGRTAPPPALPPDAAYVFFTSGTTGEPKGVVGSHRGLAHFLDWERRALRTGPGDRVAQLTALSFDVVLRDLLLPLTTGATLVLPEEPALRLDPARVVPWLEARRITVLHAVPAVARAWLAALPAPAASNAPPPRLESLRWVLFAGEPLAADLVERWRRAFPHSPSAGAAWRSRDPDVGAPAPGSPVRDGGILNLYGPTETTLAKCFHPVGEPPEPGIQPVGRPLPDTQALLLEGDRRCGLGEIGEIVLRTPFRSLGYLGSVRESVRDSVPASVPASGLDTVPETAGDPARRGEAGAADGRRTFFPNPFRRPDTGADEPADLLYATGDLGRFRLDGRLEILGRKDRQVKVRGMRVEPAEVEAALDSHPEVGAAAVVVVGSGDPDGTAAQLVAWIVPAAAAPPPDWEALSRRLRSHLGRRLPAALVPSRFLPLDRLPTGPTGKLDRSALPAVPPVADREPEPPRDAVEEAVVEVFRQVLGRERVGVRDGFFELGGHSLLALPLLGRLEERFGVRLPLAALFERTTPEELAGLLRVTGRGRRPRSPLVTLQPGEGSSLHPPLYLVHPGGGGVLCYADLARALGPRQPLHALQSVGLDGGEEPLRSLDAMAERYLDALHRLRREEGRGSGEPWHLAGWSFGGRVVFEMARRLEAAGERPGLVALLDVTPDPRPGGAGGGTGAAEEDDPALLARALADAFPVVAEELRGLDDAEQLEVLLRGAREAGRLPAGVDPERGEALLRVFKANMAAARAFRQRPWPSGVAEGGGSASRLLVVRAADSDRWPPGDPTGGWGDLAPSVEVVAVPGDHHSMVRPPHVARLAAVLRAALERRTSV